MPPTTFSAPPNAIIFGSGRITIARMVRAGIVINLVSAPIIALMAWWLGPKFLGG